MNYVESTFVEQLVDERNEFVFNLMSTQKETVIIDKNISETGKMLQR